MVALEWQGNWAFEATPPSGNRIVMDALPELGGENRGPTPVETLLAAVGACSAMDVISILEKKRQVVTKYRVEVDGDRVPQGEWPRPFLAIRIRHVLSGENLDPQAVARAVELSDTKYCSVSATLRSSPTITTDWVIE